jgi:hypothetical protein
MIGALIYRENLATSTAVAPTNEGDLTVSKAVVGSQDTSATFSFTVTLSGDNAALNGEYGDMTFDGGVAKFSLAAGESKTATNLPAGLHYAVTEDAADGYATTSKNAEGVITSGLTAEGDITPAGKAQAAFTNTLKPTTPDQPDNPDNPDQPDQPDQPNNPTNPDNPSTPDNPTSPGTPDNPGGSTETPFGSVTGTSQSATGIAPASTSSASGSASSTPSTGDAMTLIPLVACAVVAASVAVLALARRRRTDGQR